MSRNKGINKLVVSDDTTPSLQELPVLASETLGVFVHSTNSTVPSKLFLSQGTSTQASFSRIEFDTDSGLGIFTDVPFVSSHDASIKFKARGTDYWKIEGVNGSSGDLLPLINNQLKIGRSGFNLAETFSRKITSDSTLALAAGGATKWNLDSGGNLIPSTANSQNFGATSTALSQIFGNQLNSGTGQALYLGSNGGAYQWRIANGTNAAFIPNSTYDIGASGSRVGKLWGTDIDITGTINSGGFSSSGDVITNSIRTIGTSDDLVIKTGTGFAEKVRITSEGNVGIGRTPSTALDVSGTATFGFASPEPNFLINLGRGTVFNRHGYINGDGTSIEFNNQQNGDLWFCTNNTEKLRITSGGNVGIGTIGTSPSEALHIKQSQPRIRLEDSDGASASIFSMISGNTAATGSIHIQADPANAGTGSYVAFDVDAQTKMIITANGKVGIGTIAPFATLDVASSLQIGKSSTPSYNFHITAESIPGLETGALRFWSGNYGAGAERMCIESNGDVGIGTTNPIAKLDVAGDIRLSSQLISTVATGMAPLSVTSTTKVSNLNADLLDDQTGSYYLNYNNLTNTPTIGNGTLTLAVSGTGLSGSASFTANQTGATTFTITSNATSANTGSTIVARDASGNFSAGTITARSIETGGDGGDGGIKINLKGTGNRNSYIDFNSQDGTEYNARIIREPGTNGELKIVHNGNRPITFVSQENIGQVYATWSFDLWFNDLVIRNFTRDAVTYLPRIKGVYEYIRSGDILITNIDKGKGLWVSNLGNVLPQLDNSHLLGNDDFRWQEVWSVDGTINTSDVRTKHTIENSPLGLNFINALRPVSYKWKVSYNEVNVQKDENGEPLLDENRKIIKTITPKSGTRTHYGLIAQEVKEVLEQIGKNGEDFAGWILSDKDDPNSQQSLRYHEFISPIIKSIQELSEIASNSTKALQSALEEIQKLKERIEILES